MGNRSFSLQCAYCSQKTCECNIPPDGLVKGGAEDLIAVLGEAETSYSFVVSVLKPPQAQATLDLPHLAHIFQKEAIITHITQLVLLLTVLIL